MVAFKALPNGHLASSDLNDVAKALPLTDTIFASSSNSMQSRERKYLEIARPVNNLLERLEFPVDSQDFSGPDSSGQKEGTEVDKFRDSAPYSSKSGAISSYSEANDFVEKEVLEAIIVDREMEALNMKRYILELESDANQTQKHLQHNHSIITEFATELQHYKLLALDYELQFKEMNSEINRLYKKTQWLEERLYLSESSVMHSSVIRLKSVSLDSLQHGH